jgi:hypothetical protein
MYGHVCVHHEFNVVCVAIAVADLHVPDGRRDSHRSSPQADHGSLYLGDPDIPDPEAH